MATRPRSYAYSRLMRLVRATIRTIPFDGYPSKVVTLSPERVIGPWREVRSRYENATAFCCGCSDADVAEFRYRARPGTGDPSEAIALTSGGREDWPYLVSEREVDNAAV